METQRIIPAKNGGYLTAGNPGNKGGGPIPQAVRQAALLATAEAIPVFHQMVQGGDDYTPLEKVAAGHWLKDVSGVKGPVTVQIENGEYIAKLLEVFSRDVFPEEIRPWLVAGAVRAGQELGCEVGSGENVAILARAAEELLGPFEPE